MHTTLAPSEIKEKCLKTLQMCLKARLTDDKMSKLVRQNKGGSFHLATGGHELVGVTAALSLISGKDWGFPYYRDRAFAIGIGVSLTDLFGALMARAIPHHSSGRMMPEHFSHKGLHLPCQSSCVGSQFLQAVGTAKALQLAGKDEVVYVSSGEGATSQGDFHEALNFAALHKLGIIFVIQDNGWAISVPVAEQTAGGSIASVARGYSGLSVYELDGCNFEALSGAFSEAVSKARSGMGASVVIAKVPRLGPHSSSDDPAKYKNPALIAEEKERDPVPRFQSWLLDSGILTASEIQEVHEQVQAEIDLAVIEAEQIPFPDPKTVTDHIFKETAPLCTQERSSDKEAIVMMDALNRALDEEMGRDKGVVIFGQDVAHGKGGVFGITRGLTAKYGVERCFNTPLAESTIIGLSIGMSFVDGFKPVVEIQFADYLWTGINQLFNELSSMHYRSNGEWNCPIVIRMPYGGYIQGGPYHSQSIEAFLAHCPGLKVVIPSNAADAKRLLKTAIRDPNPVMFLEHKALYRQRVFCARPEPSDEELLPFGVAKVVREGSDITFVGWGMMVVMASEIAERLSQEEISIEIIDLRTLVPLDMKTVIRSLKKTGKLMIAHEAPGNGGFGAEIAARISEEGFNYLDAPVVRVTGKNCCVPYAKDLEDAVLPQKSDLEKAFRQLAGF